MTDQRIKELEARIVVLEKVLNMGFDDDSAAHEFVGMAEIYTDAVGGYRVIPKAEIERVLGKEPVCPHKWSMWQETDQYYEVIPVELWEAERACKWCGYLDTKLRSEIDHDIRPFPDWSQEEGYWVWEGENG